MRQFGQIFLLTSTTTLSEIKTMSLIFVTIAALDDGQIAGALNEGIAMLFFLSSHTILYSSSIDICKNRIGLFCLFLIGSNINNYRKIVEFSWNRTRIYGDEDEHC